MLPVGALVPCAWLQHAWRHFCCISLLLLSISHAVARDAPHQNCSQRFDLLAHCCCCAGRWKAVTVAVKIIEHSERSPGTASSGGKRINIGRESLLATQMSHPNIVSNPACCTAAP
jgi:hypothetical protein